MDITQLSSENFEITTHEIGGKNRIFVRPKPQFQEWSKDNLIFRSSIWNLDGTLISASFRKFFNLDERPELDPFPSEFRNVSVMEKIDGSALIISRIDSFTICRTRGSIDSRTMPNGNEITLFHAKYAEFFSWLESVTNIEYSFVFEWVSPHNKIILDYGNEPNLFLTAIINHKNYSMWSQDDVDKIAEQYKLKRPLRYFYKDLQSLVNDVELWNGKEGVCVYYNNDQCIRKVKSAQYLKLHAFKSNLTLKNVTKLFFDSDYTSEYSFLNYLTQTFDFECSKAAQPYVTKLFSILNELNEEDKRIASFVDANRNLDQKSYALTVKDKLPSTLFGLAFTMRNNPTVTKDSKLKRVLAKVADFNLEKFSFQESGK